MEKPRSKANPKTDFLVIRISPEDRGLVAEAAAEEDLEVSTWARRVVLQAARKAAERRARRKRRGAGDEP
jgi:uncharacterized protein (DUF1778 family)